MQLALADNGELRADGEADSDSQDEPQCVALARESAGKGSKYGQWVLARFHARGQGGVAMDYDAAVALWMLAALQNYDRAQGDLGSMFHDAENSEEALRWFKAGGSSRSRQGIVHDRRVL